jgi:hypothetical protein
MNKINFVMILFILNNVLLFLFLADGIANAISSPGLGASDLYDNADLERELAELAEDEVEPDIINIGSLPDVPITKKTKEKDDSLRELEAWTE